MSFRINEKTSSLTLRGLRHTERCGATMCPARCLRRAQRRLRSGRLDPVTVCIMICNITHDQLRGPRAGAEVESREVQVLIIIILALRSRRHTPIVIVISDSTSMRPGEHTRIVRQQTTCAYLLPDRSSKAAATELQGQQQFMNIHPDGTLTPSRLHRWMGGPPYAHRLLSAIARARA